MSDHVTRPADLAGASLRELLDAWRQHTARLVGARYGIGEPLRPARLGHHALSALATGQALADRLTASRWVTAADALAYGAPLAQVAAVLGLEPVEVAAGLRSWADGQHEHAGMTAATRDEVYALVAAGGALVIAGQPPAGVAGDGLAESRPGAAPPRP